MKEKKRTLVIPDIHGRIDMLKKILHAMNYNKDEDKLIFLGDYIDRGFHSREVLYFIMQLKETNPDIILLRGNHDDWFISYLEGKLSDYDSSIHLMNWLDNGGFTTIESFIEDDNCNYISGYEKINELYPEILPFLKTTQLYTEDSYFYYAHAGVSPFISKIEDNKENTFIWMDRDIFYNTTLTLDKPIIVGHTVTRNIDGKDAPYVAQDKIAIDGGAVFGFVMIGMAIDNATGTYEFTILDSYLDK